jgi:Domain of unknown function (DUF4129)
MSEAALAPSISQRAQIASRRTRRSQLSPLEAMERGFAVFRSTFAREAWRYYVGAAPLVLCFVPFWVIDGQIQVSNATLLAETALLSAAYLLRVLMVGSYMQHVREKAYGTPVSKPSGATARTAALARLLTWKIMLSVGALVTLPTLAAASWFYGGCQFAGLEAYADNSERHSFSSCLALSSQWFGPGLLLFFMLVPLWGAVWLNGAILAVVLPELLHSILGVDTLLSTQMGMWALIQSSAFWLSLFAGAWLALDPIVKCTYVVVYQHLRSRREGDDLRGLLATLPREQEKKSQMIASHATSGKLATGALFVFATILASVSLAVPARALQVSQPGATIETNGGLADQARIEKLRTALSQESQRAIYRWHDAEHPSPPTWFDRLLAKIGEALKRTWDALWNFLHKLWPSGVNLSLGDEKGAGWHLKDLRFWVTVIAILTLATGIMLFWLRRRRGTTPISIPMQIAPLLDLSDSSAAIERSEDEWFSLARQLEGQGELRLALRAAYFGLLAGLAQREWLTIRRDRTNREYLNEFTRRWRRRPQAAVEARMEVPDRLRGSLRQFDGVWYGLHPVTSEQVATYRQNQREFLNHV